MEIGTSMEPKGSQDGCQNRYKIVAKIDGDIKGDFWPTPGSWGGQAEQARGVGGEGERGGRVLMVPAPPGEDNRRGA